MGNAHADAWHLGCVLVASEQLQLHCPSRPRPSLGGERPKRSLADDIDAGQARRSLDPGGGCGPRVGQAEGVMEAGPAVAILQLRDGGCWRQDKKARCYIIPGSLV